VRTGCPESVKNTSAEAPSFCPWSGRAGATPAPQPHCSCRRRHPSYSPGRGRGSERVGRVRQRAIEGWPSGCWRHRRRRARWHLPEASFVWSVPGPEDKVFSRKKWAHKRTVRAIKHWLVGLDPVKILSIVGLPPPPTGWKKIFTLRLWKRNTPKFQPSSVDLELLAVDGLHREIPGRTENSKDCTQREFFFPVRQNLAPSARGVFFSWTGTGAR
jgi:hypothetical protein